MSPGTAVAMRENSCRFRVTIVAPISRAVRAINKSFIGPRRSPEPFPCRSGKRRPARSNESGDGEICLVVGKAARIRYTARRRREV